MKIENVSNEETGFKPIVLKITIESKKEYIAMKEMCSTNVSIPELLDIESQYVIKEFLEKTFRIIINN